MPRVQPVEETSSPAWWRWFLLALFAAALMWRAVVLSRLGGGPLLTMLNVDAAIYWDWASLIRSGHWVSENPFFLGPLYPHWLAVIRTFLGDQIQAVLWVQAVLGSATVILVADTTRRIATPATAAIIGVVVAGYAMAVVFDLLILMESLLLFLGSLALWLMVRNGRLAPLLVGTCVGLMALGRPTFLLSLLPYSLYVAHRRRSQIIPTLGSVWLVPIALALITGHHHRHVDGAWMPFTYSGGYNAYVGNGPQANGTYVEFADAFGTDESAAPDVSGGVDLDERAYLQKLTGRRLGAVQSAQCWFELTLAHVRAHPRRAARLLLMKVAMLFNHRELPQIIDAKVHDRAAGPLGWPLELGFAFFGVGGLLGATLGWRRGPETRLIVGSLVMLTIGAAAFFVVDRYRIHLVPPLAVLAGVGLTELATIWKRRATRAIAVAAGVMACGAALMFAPIVPSSKGNADWGYATTLGEAWLVKGDPRSALPWLEQAARLDRSGALRGSETRTGRVARASAYENLGIAHSELGEDEPALASLAAAVRLAPEAPSTRSRYAGVLAASGACDSAAVQYGLAGVPLREAAEQLAGEAARYHNRGDAPATRKYLEAAACLQPGYEGAVIPLVRLDILAGAHESALSQLRRAETVGVDVHVVRAHLAWISALEGDTTSVRRILQTIPAEVRASDPRVAATLDLLRQGAAR